METVLLGVKHESHDSVRPASTVMEITDDREIAQDSFNLKNCVRSALATYSAPASGASLTSMVEHVVPTTAGKVSSPQAERMVRRIVAESEKAAFFNEKECLEQKLALEHVLLLDGDADGNCFYDAAQSLLRPLDGSPLTTEHTPSALRKTMAALMRSLSGTALDAHLEKSASRSIAVLAADTEAVDMDVASTPATWAEDRNHYIYP